MWNCGEHQNVHTWNWLDQELIHIVFFIMNKVFSLVLYERYHFLIVLNLMIIIIFVFVWCKCDNCLLFNAIYKYLKILDSIISVCRRKGHICIIHEVSLYIMNGHLASDSPFGVLQRTNCKYWLWFCFRGQSHLCPLGHKAIYRIILWGSY